MSVFVNGKEGVFHLRGSRTSYLMDVHCGTLRHLYYGLRVESEAAHRLVKDCRCGFMADFLPPHKGQGACPDTMPREYSGHEDGDFRVSCLVPRTQDGDSVCRWQYRGYQLLEQYPRPDGLPFLRAGQTLAVCLREEEQGLEATLYYAMLEDSDVLVRHAVITNRSSAPVVLDSALSFCMDLQAEGWDILSLHGRHAFERQIDRHPMSENTEILASRRGISSHQVNPVCALMEHTATETSGQVLGCALVYSGNFALYIQPDSFGGVRLAGGIHPETFRWNLAPGESFTTPQAVFTFSAHGLGEMSRNFADAYRQGLIHGAYSPRPVVLNSWEAAYFDFDEAKLLAMIDSAAGTGIDTFVLDDGWFGSRDKDDSSLGDWTPDPRKLPNGLKPLARRCREHGMKFGLWIEPEMISENSELYRRHPDWAVKGARHQAMLSRNQMILDLSRREVVAYLKAAFDSLLADGDIAYVKWDMNRNVIEYASVSCTGGEFAHRYMLGVYELAEYVTTRYPQVLIEGCCGGGGRFDAGMLYYFPQIWTSDNTDAEERTRIQYATSLFYPLSAMTAHVSVCPNHQTGRQIDFDSRALVTRMCVTGYELDLRRLTAEEYGRISGQVKEYRALETMMLTGDCYRIADPFAGNRFCVQVVAPDKSQGYAIVYQRLTSQGLRPFYLKLQGLQPQARYHVIYGADEWEADGATLMQVGIPCHLLRRDFAAEQILFRRIGETVENTRG